MEDDKSKQAEHKKKKKECPWGLVRGRTNSIPGYMQESQQGGLAEK